MKQEIDRQHFDDVKLIAAAHEEQNLEKINHHGNACRCYCKRHAC